MATYNLLMSYAAVPNMYFAETELRFMRQLPSTQTIYKYMTKYHHVSTWEHHNDKSLPASSSMPWQQNKHPAQLLSCLCKSQDRPDYRLHMVITFLRISRTDLIHVLHSELHHKPFNCLVNDHKIALKQAAVQ